MIVARHGKCQVAGPGRQVPQGYRMGESKNKATDERAAMRGSYEPAQTDGSMRFWRISRRGGLFCLALVTLAILAAQAVPDAAEAEFTAEVSVKTAAGFNLSGKVFVKGPKKRNEMTIGTRIITTIVREDKKVTWTLLPGTRQYRESPLRFDPLNPNSDLPHETKELGPDKVNGYDCKRILWTFKNPNQGSLLQWYAPALKAAVRYQIKDKAGKLASTTDYQKVKPGPQADSLFEVPPGYTKVPGSK
jgi:hypothetical protein